MIRKNRNVLIWIWQVAGKERTAVFYITFFEVFLSATAVASAWLMRGLIDRAVSGDKAGFIRFAVFYGCLIVSQLVCRALYRHMHASAGAALKNRFQSHVFSALLRKDYAAVTAVHSGQWLSRLTSDSGVVSGNLLGIVPQLTGLAVRFLGALWLVVQLIPGAALLIIPGGIFMVSVSLVFRGKLKKLHQNIQDAEARVLSFFTEGLGGMLVLRTFGQEERSAEMAEERMDDCRQAVLRHSRFSNFCNVCLGTGLQGVYLASLVYCAYHILVGTMSYGTFLAVNQLIGQIQSPLVNISGFLPRYYAMIASAERLMEPESFADDLKKPVLGEEKIQNLYENLTSLGTHGLSFSYGEGEPEVLRSLELEVNKGEYVAFTGHSGCGKSTVLKLLLGLYTPERGSCFLKGEAGEIPLGPEHRGLFAYVPQGNHLMSGTLREAVCFGQAVADEKIWQALKIACAEEFVKSMEKGLDTPIGERGAGLSEGQIQRIAIARAIYSGRPILLLDEATSSLDEGTERQLLCNLRELTDKTVFIITHRPAALEICDKIIPFEGGKEP